MQWSCYGGQQVNQYMAADLFPDDAAPNVTLRWPDLKGDILPSRAIA